MAVLFACLAGLSVMVLTIGVTRRAPSSTVRRRLRQFDDEQIEAPTDRSFAQRVLAPGLSRLTRMIAALMPGGIQRSVAARLETAGIKAPPSRFMTIWLALSVVLPLVFVLLAIASGGRASSGQLMTAFSWAMITTSLPWLALSRKARSRTEAIDRSLSDAMDLIVTNLEAGVGLQAAMINVAQKFHGPLAVELSRVINEVGLGRPRDEALEAMVRRTGSREMSLFARAVSQAERNGIPIGRVLRGQAAEFRERRRQAARERANTFPLRITVITVIFIFPTLFLLILGPVALNALEFFNEQQ